MHSKVTPLGFKPKTFRTGIWRSIQLSYGALVPAKIRLSLDLTKRFHYFIFISTAFPKAFSHDFNLFSTIFQIFSEHFENLSDFFLIFSDFLWNLSEIFSAHWERHPSSLHLSEDCTVKTSKISILAYVRVRALQQIRTFCFHNLHRFLHNPLENKLLQRFFRHLLTFLFLIPPKRRSNQEKGRRKTLRKGQ